MLSYKGLIATFAVCGILLVAHTITVKLVLMTPILFGF
jgi:hypothetical protein